MANDPSVNGYWIYESMESPSIAARSFQAMIGLLAVFSVSLDSLVRRKTSD